MKLKLKNKLIIWISLIIFGQILLTIGLILYSNASSGYATMITGQREYVDSNSSYIRTFYLLKNEKVNIEIFDNKIENNNFSIGYYNENKELICNETELKANEDGNYSLYIKNSKNYPIEFNIKLKPKYVNKYYENYFNFSYLLIISGMILIIINLSKSLYSISKLEKN